MGPRARSQNAGTREREREGEKKSLAERKDYIGDFGFRVSSGPKPISRFSVFPPARAATRIRCPLYERRDELGFHPPASPTS